MDDIAPKKPPPEQPDIIRHDAERFNEDMQALTREAETMRLKYMKAMRSRSFLSMSVGLISIIIGALGFGWFLLVQGDLLKALASIALGTVLAAALHLFTEKALKDYKSAYKREFLPKLARVLGGFKYHPARGISRKIISKTGIVPAHHSYDAEDCFMGQYKGVKVLFSEARLRAKQAYIEPIFDGLFVLLEIPEPMIAGHIILTADEAAVQKWRGTRWKQLKEVPTHPSNEEWDRFAVFSNKPEEAQKVVSDTLLKELSEASDIFDESPISVVLFHKKYIFMMIPYSGDMFEASELHMPVATKQHALRCKREIEQILEIIDIFEIYQKNADPVEDVRVAHTPIEAD